MLLQCILDHRFSFTRHFTETYTKLNNCPNFAGSMTSILKSVAFTAALLKHDCSVTRNSKNFYFLQNDVTSVCLTLVQRFPRFMGFAWYFEHIQQLHIGRFQAIKTDVLLIFSFITGDKTEFLSPMMFSNEYITGI